MVCLNPEAWNKNQVFVRFFLLQHLPQKNYKCGAQINCNFESQRASFANLTIENVEPGEAVKFAKTHQRHILPAK